MFSTLIMQKLCFLYLPLSRGKPILKTKLAFLYLALPVVSWVDFFNLSSWVASIKIFKSFVSLLFSIAYPEFLPPNLGEQSNNAFLVKVCQILGLIF